MKNKNNLVAYSLFPFGDTLHAQFKTGQQWSKRKPHKSNARPNVYWPCGVQTNSSTKYHTHTGHTPTNQTTTLTQIAIEFEFFSLFTKSTANNSYFTQTLDCQAFDSVARLHDCRQNGNKSRSQWKLRMCSPRKWSNFLRFFCVASIRQKRFVHLKITMCKESWHRATNGMLCLCVCFAALRRIRHTKPNYAIAMLCVMKSIGRSVDFYFFFFTELLWNSQNEVQHLQLQWNAKLRKSCGKTSLARDIYSYTLLADNSYRSWFFFSHRLTEVVRWWNSSHVNNLWH